MTPKEILESVYERAVAAKGTVIGDEAIRERVEYVALCTANRAGVRLLMACLLAKLHQPHVDPRNPYTEIGGGKSFSGRRYDEDHLMGFINEHRLPANPTTAFLTPTLRNIDAPLTVDRDLVGRPRALYQHSLALLDNVAKGRVQADLSGLLLLLTLGELSQHSQVARRD